MSSQSFIIVICNLPYLLWSIDQSTFITCHASLFIFFDAAKFHLVSTKFNKSFASIYIWFLFGAQLQKRQDRNCIYIWGNFLDSDVCPASLGIAYGVVSQYFKPLMKISAVYSVYVKL